MDPNMILILLKVLDIAAALALRLGERDAENEAFIAKVRSIIVDKGGVPSDEDFAEIMAESVALTSQLEDLLDAKG